MKTLGKIIIGIVIGALAMFLYYQNKSEMIQDELESLRAFDQKFDIDSDLIEKWNGKKEVHPSNTGKPISIDKARNKIDAFKNWGILKEQPYGFGFGLNNITEMIKQINIHNQVLRAQTVTDTISGIRIYLAKNNSPVDGQPKDHLDVILVPVRFSGKNYIPMSDQGDEPSIGISDSVLADPRIDSSKYSLKSSNPLVLNNSWPCPDICD